MLDSFWSYIQDENHRGILTFLGTGIVGIPTAIYYVWKFLKKSDGDSRTQFGNQTLTTNTSGENNPVFNDPVSNSQIHIGSSVPPEMVADWVSNLQQNARTQQHSNEHIDLLQQQLQQLEKRYNELKSSIELERRNSDADDAPLLKKANEATTQGDFEHAAELLGMLARQKEDKVEQAAAYNYQTGRAQQLALAFDKALPCFEKAWRYRPSNAQYSLAYGEALSQQGNRAKAESVLWETQKVLQTKEDKDSLASVKGSLANLMAVEPNRRDEAEKLYREGLGIYRELAKAQPAVFQQYVATSLNNLAAMVSDDSSRRDEAEKLYREGLGIYRELAKAQPAVFQQYVATSLNNLAAMVSDDSSRRDEAEKLYRESLSIRRELAKAQPAIFTDNLCQTLLGMTVMYMQQQKWKSARTTLDEASGLLRPLAAQIPDSIYGHLLAYAESCQKELDAGA